LTSVHAPAAGETRVCRGGLPPAAAWLNGAPLDANAASVSLKAGANALLLRYDKPGRGHVVVGVPPPAPRGSDAAAMPWNVDLASRWHGVAGILPFDTRPQTAKPAGWYRFVAPPGLRSVGIPTTARVRAWADGRELAVRAGDGPVTASIETPSCAPVIVALRVEQERGAYGGAAFTGYLRLECDPGELAAGDWAKSGVLETYSGGAWYRRTVMLSAGQLGGPVTLDLGDVVASAEVRVNGQPAGVRVAPPWTFDLSRLVNPGANRIEVLVCNTLANHYVTIPTHYRGATTSGLLGPVTLSVAGPGDAGE
jgi:hypothetical protein